ncbi:unnamed protein product [Ilex paraguariensis]|uniref:Uncharacterized protein n=1 Tax=Ilex paraguariensis TaxID=185542 RepID=A0ABC8U0S1_9AQUA
MELENSRFGEFARITQMMDNGKRKGLIIPKGSQGIGWKGFRGLTEDALSARMIGLSHTGKGGSLHRRNKGSPQSRKLMVKVTEANRRAKGGLELPIGSP